jgi:Zn-dependent protease
VTLNPLAHIDPFGTILLPALLFWVGGPMFGYARPVPVQVDMLPRRSRAQVLISAAGPASNLLMAAGSLMLLVGIGSGLRLWVGGAEVSNLANPGWGATVRISGFAGASMLAAACTLLKGSFVINVVLALFNLIPIPPLDGSWVLEHLFPRTLGRIYQVLRPYGMLVFVVAVYAHVFDYGMRPVAHVLGLGFMLLHRTSGAW